MENKSSSTSAQAESKRDVYAIITERIIELLEKGTVPWKKPWIEAGIPRILFRKDSIEASTSGCFHSSITKRITSSRGSN